MRLSEAVAYRVKELLAERNMTQGQLEKLSTVHRATMNDLMKAAYKTVNLKTVYLIIKALGMTCEKFFASPVFEREDIEAD